MTSLVYPLMNKDLKNTAVPPLRFPEFCDTEGWEEMPLSNVAKLITEKTGAKSYTLMSVTAGIGLVSQIEKFGREIAGEAYKNYYVIKKGDFAYNKSSVKQHPEGQIALLENTDMGAVPNSIFTCFRVDEKYVSPYFLKYPFANNIHGKWLRKFISVGARANGALNVDSKDLLALPIFLPSLAEQQKIASCLTSLDELITAQSQKLDALKVHKKGLMQQLFPADGETVPQLRFKEWRDTEGWESCKIGDFIESHKGGAALTPTDFVSYSKCEVIPKKAITEGLWLKMSTENPTYCSEDFFNDNLQSVVDSKCLITTLRDLVPSGPSIGYIVKYTGEKKYILAQGVYGLKTKETLVSDFLIHFSNTPQYRKLMNAIMVGSTQVHIRNGDFLNLPFNVPSKAEQQKIADCLSSLDDVIAAESEQLAALKGHKKGLMQKLFPNTNDDVEE